MSLAGLVPVQASQKASLGQACSSLACECAGVPSVWKKRKARGSARAARRMKKLAASVNAAT